MNKEDMTNKREIGTEHETEACAYLEESGYEIVEKNFRRKEGEIDIIARDGAYLVFIEVKYRADDRYGGASYAISVSKQRRIRAVARVFLNERGHCGCRYFRFDAILITGDKLEQIKNAWQ